MTDPVLSTEHTEALQVLGSFADMGISALPPALRAHNLQASKAAMQLIIAALPKIEPPAA